MIPEDPAISQDLSVNKKTTVNIPVSLLLSLFISISKYFFFFQADKISKTVTRGKYVQYTAELRAQIGRYAARHGNAAAVRHFTHLLARDISESSVRGMRDKFLGKYSRNLWNVKIPWLVFNANIFVSGIVTKCLRIYV